MHALTSFVGCGFGDAGGFGDVEEHTRARERPLTNPHRGGFGDAKGFGDAGGFDYTGRSRRGFDRGR